jgi:hypothetical protein
MVTNQFGTIEVEVRRPLLMLVPTAESLVSPPPHLVKPTLDHFKCHQVAGARTRLKGLVVQDQFSPYEVQILKPYRLCLAADKAGLGIQMPNAHLLCYQSRVRPPRPYRAPFFISNQFHDLEIAVAGGRDFCVPSTVP